MYRNKKARKQKLSLKNLYRFGPRSPQPLSLQKHRFKLRSSSLLVGLTATVGITSIAFAATQQDLHVKSNQINKASASSSTPLNNKMSADVTIKSSSSADSATQTDDGTAQGSTQDSDNNAQVTINNESIPVNSGTIHRTYTDDNGSTYSVTINVDSNSTSQSSSHSYTDIDINTSGTSSSNNSTRGSPRR